MEAEGAEAGKKERHVRRVAHLPPVTADAALLARKVDSYSTMARRVLRHALHACSLS